jgi:hypothetical protein
MIINFIIRGRLGNAIFRYMASVIMCLYCNGNYSINNNQRFCLNDAQFLEIIEKIVNGKDVNINDILRTKYEISGLNMINYYQHDLIYKLHKNYIIEYIKKNRDHYILTDGINAGDMNCEKFYMIDIINTPSTFNKCYKNVLHIRLEDFVTHNLYLSVERIINLIDKNIISDSLCVVCKKTEIEFELNYIYTINQHLLNKGIEVIFEHNDTLTDFYIMKEAELLICSKSTLSWCAAFFSDKLKKCYMPDYIETPNQTCKYPIDNTELY